VFTFIEEAMTFRSRLPEFEHVCIMRMLNDMQHELTLSQMPLFAPVVKIE
jgi:hypothetical protein